MSAIRPQPYRAGRLGRHANVVLTYDNTAQTDGIGAQLQRIYGIYSIAKLLGTSYLHSPLTRVDYQGFAALEDDAFDPGFHHEFNDLFQIPSDAMPSDELHEITLADLTLNGFYQLVALADTCRRDGKGLLARLTMPYAIADRFPDCYEVCKNISPFVAPARNGRDLRVAIHVRRGELLVLDCERMLPNAYYVSVAQAIAGLLEALDVGYQLELCTEVPDHDFIIRPDQPGISGRIGAPVAVTRQMCRLDEFGALSNLVHCINETTMECIRRLATADILVMSRSSFSYLGGILNRRGIVLYHPFWHGAPSSWIEVSVGGQFDLARLRAVLTDDWLGV